MTIAWKDAKPKIDELMQAAANGEQIVIQLEDGKDVEIKAHSNSTLKRRHGFGSAKSQVWMSEDFKEIPEAFKEYIE